MIFLVCDQQSKFLEEKAEKCQKVLCNFIILWVINASKIIDTHYTVAVLPIGQYSLLADSHSWSNSLKFGIDINKRSKILFYQLAEDFEVILPIGRRVTAFS